MRLFGEVIGQINYRAAAMWLWEPFDKYIRTPILPLRRPPGVADTVLRRSVATTSDVLRRPIAVDDDYLRR